MNYEAWVLLNTDCTDLTNRFSETGIRVICEIRVRF